MHSSSLRFDWTHSFWSWTVFKSNTIGSNTSNLKDRSTVFYDSKILLWDQIRDRFETNHRVFQDWTGSRGSTAFRRRVFISNTCPNSTKLKHFGKIVNVSEKKDKKTILFFTKCFVNLVNLESRESSFVNLVNLTLWI